MGAVVRRNPFRDSQGQDHAGVPDQGKRQPCARQRIVADQRNDPDLPADHAVFRRYLH
ncbi:hypothetical protein D3C76_1860070 [compost metagenome]